MRSLSVLFCLVLLIGSVMSQDLLVHVDDPTEADEAAANIINYFIQAPNANVAAVFNGVGPIIFSTPGNSLLKEYEEIYRQYPNQFQVLLCNNSIHGLNIPASAFPSFTTIVPAAVASIAELQQKGYGYIKP
ncbi:hypothetical protein SAMD00019534_080400 [Acytostelium subglobosum LB1]|uniref:hypothetical protein n=1 Tax=Acytostelium subglobosum LB1 TaxID=1410327 RepID=UPI0006451D86|nr:hypothetical protein SAMD00019534_080400 [Acytostelium subglobosum LB1]GAM24865.1 hypothetical protein SAMD00019534_080400 [Acytostelium subglobosum LB1]|eukprot:XP_012751954.1 hypothetical protein SAMD00019534_080400 [Acytostelium subglobosum LB1]